MLLLEVVTDVSQEQEVVMLGTPTVLLYNGFLVGGQKRWARATVARRPETSRDPPWSLSTEPALPVFIRQCLQFTKSLFNQR